MIYIRAKTRYIRDYAVDKCGAFFSVFQRLTSVLILGLLNCMNWILVCVEKPQNNKQENEWLQWFALLESAKASLEIMASSKMLSESIWLFALNKGLRSHNLLVGLASSRGLKTRVFLLEDEPVLCE